MRDSHFSGTLRNARGVTLTELMVAVVILTIGVLGMFGAFQYINMAIHGSRTKTLATNLAQERIEALKNSTYYELLVTTSSSVDSTVSPAVTYDNSNYPPETISVGGIIFTRYTLVTMAQMTNNVITSVSNTYPDTGMKEISVSIVWADNGVRKSWTLNNLLENPFVNPLDSSLSGYAATTAGVKLPGVRIDVEQYPDYSATTDASGSYSFRVYHGTYTVRMSSAGYFDWVSPIMGIVQGSNAVLNSSMTAIASGTVNGIAWYNPNLVISEVVGTTHTCTGVTCTGGYLNDVEYVELFNPTTFQINVVTPPAGAGPWSAGSVVENIKINTTVGGNGYSDIMDCGGGNCVYLSSYVAPGGYYLLASFPTFMVNGVWVTADAYFKNSCGGPPADCIADVSYGGIQIQDALGNNIDRVCWKGSGGTPPAAYCNGTIIPTDSNCGLDTSLVSGACPSPRVGNELVRFSSPTVMARTMFTGTYGSAYNSQNNAADYIYPVLGNVATEGLPYNPFTTASPVLPVITGIPAVGAQVSASDPNSGSGQSVSAYAAGPAPWSQPQLYAPFELDGVSTGTWNLDVALASSPAYAQLVGVTIAAQGSVVGVPNAATVPAWSGAGLYHVVMTTSSLDGFIKGMVTDSNNSALSGITVQCAGQTKTTGANGLYFMNVSSGPDVIIVNPNNANPTYVQQLYPVTVDTGQILTQDAALSQGVTLQGYMTTGTTPVPNFTVTANLNGNQYASAVTNNSGVFTMRNLSTGTYIVEPALDVGQDSNPPSITMPAPSGTVFVGTFTVSGAFGSIGGTITNNGALVTAGALILASTGTIGSIPPSIAGSSAPALCPIYAISSKADGTYSLPVRGSLTYNLSVYIPKLSGTTAVTTSYKTYPGIAVAPGLVTTQNVVLP